MEIRLFAEKFRLKTQRDECDETIIPGRLGQIYVYGSGKFGCMVLANSSRVWSAARRKLVAAGCQVIQNGDAEGTAPFDPADPGQAKLAIQVIKAKRRRQLSEAQRAALMGRLRSTRQCQVTPDLRLISAEAA